MYVQITAGRFCAHGVDPLSSRDSRGMLDLQDCGGRLSCTQPHSDSLLILFSPPPVQFWLSFRRSFLLPSSLTSTVTSVCSEIRCSRCGFQQYIYVNFLNAFSRCDFAKRLNIWPTGSVPLFLSLNCWCFACNISWISTVFFLCIPRTQYFENKGRT